MAAIYELLFFLVTSIAMGPDKERKRQVTKKSTAVKPAYVLALVAWVCFVLWMSYLYNN
jgi:hypothetical protein